MSTVSITSISKSKAILMAARPKTLSASFVPVLVGTALVLASQQQVNLWLSLSALLCSFCIQIGTNIVNDALDFVKGTDTAARIGPMRITQQGIMPPQRVLVIGICFLSAALLCGIPLMTAGGPPLITLLCISVLCGYLYTGGPYPIGYVGLSEPFILSFFGLGAIGGLYYAQTGTINALPLLAGLQIGMLACVMNCINNLRDRSEDMKSNKNSLAVRYGVRFAKLEIAFMALVPFLLGFYWLSFGYRFAAILPWIAFPLAWSIVRLIWRTQPSPLYNSFLAFAGLTQLLFGILLSIGLLLNEHTLFPV